MEGRFFIKALGCKVSQSDAASVAQFMNDRGYQLSLNINEANVIVLQTCTVTKNSDSEARQLIRQIKKVNPSAKIIVMGCYAERAPAEIYDIGVDAVIGNLGINKWQKLKEILNFSESSNEYLDPNFYPLLKTLNRTRPFLKIYDGCNHRCSYCIVPLVRGKGRSLHPSLAIEQLKKLINLGYKEISITGVNLASYGEDLGIEKGLLLLAKEIEKIEGEFRVRFSSIEPSIRMKDFFEFLCEGTKIVPHFHLPVQHMSEKILNDMRRPYKIEEFLEITNLLLKKSKKACIGTDIITGFPTEDDKEFQISYEALQKAPIHYFHIFKYSPRPGTPAFFMKSSSPERIIKERSKLLLDLSKTKFTNFKKSLIGETFQILTFSGKEEVSKGLTENYIHVKIKSEKGKIKDNTFVYGRLFIHNEEFYAQVLNT